MVHKCKKSGNTTVSDYCLFSNSISTVHWYQLFYLCKYNYWNVLSYDIQLEVSEVNDWMWVHSFPVVIHGAFCQFKACSPTCAFLHLEFSRFPTWRSQPGPPPASPWGRSCSEICAIYSQLGSTWFARNRCWSKARRSGTRAGASGRWRSHSGPQISTAAPSCSDLRPRWHPHLPSGAMTTAGPRSSPATGPSPAFLWPPPRLAWTICCSGASLCLRRSRRRDDGVQSETWQLLGCDKKRSKETSTESTLLNQGYRKKICRKKLMSRKETQSIIHVYEECCCLAVKSQLFWSDENAGNHPRVRNTRLGVSLSKTSYLSLQLFLLGKLTNILHNILNKSLSWNVKTKITT